MPTIRIEIPAAASAAVQKAFKALGVAWMPVDPSTVRDNVSWREAESLSDDQVPGKVLSGLRYREGLTQKQLEEMTGIPQRHISEMENNKRPIGKNTAKILAKALDVTYKVFL
jgi:coproporphyrinogen III oxidase-like Fe-S oxidoreductase